MRYAIFVFILVFAAVLIGCSGVGDITQPDAVREAEVGPTHLLCGLYQFRGFPDEQRLEIIPLRQAALHLNAVPMLEPNPPTQLYVGLQGGFEIDSHSLKCKIKLTHPFAGINKFTGFDVCGIIIGHGSTSPYYDPGLFIAGENEVHLANADGMTRWWNPAEFPISQGSIMAYNDGFLGTPHSFANFTATLNGYKYFADGLGPYDDASTVPVASRGVFSPGATNVRYYDIEFGSGSFMFNYAVDACWANPTANPPQIPDDFPPFANRVEAWTIAMDVSDNTLWNDGADNGGSLDLSVTVYDHYLPEDNKVRIESPGNLLTGLQTTPVDIHEGYAVFDFSFVDATPVEDSIDLFITVENTELNYGGLLPGKFVSTYFLETVEVGTYGPGIDDDLIVDVMRNTYAPFGSGYPQTWITSVDLDWGDLPDAAQYAIYRASPWADPYDWVCIGTTDSSTTEFSNTTDDTFPIDWDADYIYEVRPRSIPDNSSSEGGPTEKAIVIMETNNDDQGDDPLNPKWEYLSGSGGSFLFSYTTGSSADEGSKINSKLMFDVLRPSSWEIFYLPIPLPDLKGQTEYFSDFAFSSLGTGGLPLQAGFCPGTMVSLPTDHAEHAPEFINSPFTHFEEGQPYNNNECNGVDVHFGGGTNWGYSGGIPIYRAAQFRMPKLLQAETDYFGIGIASDGCTLNYVVDIAFDSVVLFVY